MEATCAKRSAPVPKLRGRMAIAWIVLALAGSSWGVPSADATDFYYDCGVLPPNTWCRSGVNHTYGYDQAYNPYQTQWRCAKLTALDTVWIYARRCTHALYTSVFSDSDGRAPYPNNSVPMKIWAANGNNANWWHIKGYGTY